MSAAGGAAAGGAAAGGIPSPGAQRVKILVVGPSKSRKSRLCSVLAGGLEDVLGPSEPTVGCRILELERAAPAAAAAGGGPITVELWDVSGDQSYENLWPAMQKDVQGLLLMFNPENVGDKEMMPLFWEWFGKSQGLTFDRCLCLSLQTSGQPAGPPAGLSLGAIPIEAHSCENQEALKRSLDKFLGRVVSAGLSGAAAGGAGAAGGSGSGRGGKK